MPVSAFVLIQCSSGRARYVAGEVSRIAGVKVARPVTGRFDVVAEVEAAELKSLGELIYSRIQAVEGVNRSETAVFMS